MAWTSPRSYTGGETLTAAILNADLRDNLNAGFPTGSLHHYIRAATTTETLVNGFALEANGIAFTRTTYSALNTLLSGLGYPFGAGNGSTTANLPDLQGRSLVGMSSGGHVDVNALGDSDAQDKALRTPKVSVSGATDAVADHVHSMQPQTGGPNETPQVQAGTGATVGSSTHQHTQAGPSFGAGAHAHAFSGASSGAYLVAGIIAVKT